MVENPKSPGGARSLGIEEPIEALAAHMDILGTGQRG
jgi:hypothetical protein